MLIILGYGRSHVDTESSHDRESACDIGDNLIPIVRAFLNGRDSGNKNETDGARTTSARNTTVASKNCGEAQRDTYWIDMMGDVFKARVRLRKALKLQKRRKERFEMTKKIFQDDMIDEPTEEGSTDDIKRKPWQELLHKGAPGSELTSEFKNHENAQLVSLPLLKIVSKMNDDWKLVYRDIVHAVSPFLIPPLRQAQLTSLSTTERKREARSA